MISVNSNFVLIKFIYVFGRIFIGLQFGLYSVPFYSLIATITHIVCFVQHTRGGPYSSLRI